MAEEKEKILSIPLREVYKKSERKRSPYAARYVAAFLQKHTKTDVVKIGQELNKAIWSRGLRKPARSVRVKIVKDGSVAKAELIGFEYKEFKTKAKTERKGMKDKLMERLGPKALQKQQEEEKVEGKAQKPEEAKPIEKVEVKK